MPTAGELKFSRDAKRSACWASSPRSAPLRVAANPAHRLQFLAPRHSPLATHVRGANWGDDLEGDGGPNFPTNWRNPGVNGSFDGHSSGDGMFFRVDYCGVPRAACLPVKTRCNLRPPARAGKLPVAPEVTDGTSNTFMLGEDRRAGSVSARCSAT